MNLIITISIILLLTVSWPIIYNKQSARLKKALYDFSELNKAYLNIMVSYERTRDERDEFASSCDYYYDELAKANNAIRELETRGKLLLDQITKLEEQS